MGNKQPKRVLFLIPNYGFGGAQKVMADHSRLLRGKAEVLEAVFNDWDAGRVYDTGHAYRSLEVAGGGSPAARIRNFFLRIRKLKALKREFRPDVTISHLEGADYVSLLSGGADRKVIVVHGSKRGDQNISGATGALRHKVLIPWLYKKADRIITVSKGIREELTGYYGLDPRKVCSLPNFFDCDAIAARAREPIDERLLPVFARPGAFRLITFARLAPEKNMQAQFAILRELRAAGHEVQLYIIGDGELRAELLASAAGAGRVWNAWSGEPAHPDADIYFLGYHAGPHAFLKHADLFLLTSLWEGFPMAFCEAMASGIAVMAADCATGPAEILGGEGLQPVHGLLPAGGLMPMLRTLDGPELGQWTAAIITLINDPDRLARMRETGQAQVRYYDIATMGQKWIDSYLMA